jgi:DNA-binding transcriptional ArsR family regulator
MTQPWTSAAQSDRDVVLDGPGLRALSHPIRVQILERLRSDGPSTASRLAGHLGLNSGATSYHLRQLAEAGLVAEAGDLGNKRDRWWRATVRATYFTAESFDSDPEAAMAYLNSIATGYAERVVEFGYRLPALPAEWAGGATMSDFRLRLTATESARMRAEIAEVVARYRREEDVADGTATAPETAAPVVVQLQIMPEVG